MYKMDNYGCNGQGYDFGKGQARTDSFRDYDSENYGWNYYPQTDSRFDYSEEEYKKDDCRCKHFKEEKHDRDDRHECKCQCRPSFRPCFPCFPCFRNRNIDCRDNKHDGEELKRPCKCPCHDKDYDNGYDNKNNQLFFYGHIEFKNCNRN